MDTNAIRNLVRAGVVSSVNPAEGTVRVVFDDKDDMVSYDLPVLNRGSMRNKDYWLPDVGEQVVCLFAPNGKNLNQGWILGSYFSDADAPQVASVDKRRIDFGDGTYIEYDRAAHMLDIHCVGVVKINGSIIHLN